MFSNRVKNLRPSLLRELVNTSNNNDYISFSGGFPDPGLFPKIDFGKISNTWMQYGKTEGEDVLREHILKVNDSIRLESSDNVSITSGSQQGIDLCCKLSIDEGTKILVESPTYLAATNCFSFYGANFCCISVDRNSIDLDKFENVIAKEKPRVFYTIPTFQNPSGYSYNQEERTEVARILDKYNVLLVEDDPYREIYFDSKPEPPICTLLSEAPWIYLGSFSKTIFPGIRIGYMISDKETMNKICQIKQNSDLHSNRLGQVLISQLVSSQAYSKHLENLRSAYLTKRNHFHDCLSHYLRDFASWRKPEGGLFYWLKLHEKHDAQKLFQSAIKRKVSVMPGSPFYVCQKDTQHLRLNFSQSDKYSTEIGLSTINQILSSAL